LSNSLLSFPIHNLTFLQEFNPSLSGVYIRNTPTPWGKIRADVIWGKNMKRKREKRVKCKRKKEEKGKKKRK
jgi:hypothetical protein